MNCPHCGGSAAFHAHRAHTSLSLVGPVRYRRAYYLCRACGKGLFPFDRNAGLTVVVISHDFAGLEELCPRILKLRDGVMEPASQPAGGLS